METNPVKAIRKYCLSCCMEQPSEVASCPAEECELHAFRMGKNPYRAKREYTPEQLKAMRQRLEDARSQKK